MNKRAALIGLLILVILALLLKRRGLITILQPQEIDIKAPPLNNVTVNFPDFTPWEIPRFNGAFPLPGSGSNFDWMNTTSVGCFCSIRTVNPYNPTISAITFAPLAPGETPEYNITLDARRFQQQQQDLQQVISNAQQTSKQLGFTVVRNCVEPNIYNWWVMMNSPCSCNYTGTERCGM